MRVALPLIALFVATVASAEQPVQNQPGATTVKPVPCADGAGSMCRDRIHEVRRELGKPALERDASPADPLLIAAVDKRIDGCAVLVMRNDTSDVRPLPAPREHRMMPAR